MVASILLALVDMLLVLLYAVVLSGYERRAMALLHNRDGPVVWGVLGLAQPLTDGTKLLTKGVAKQGNPSNRVSAQLPCWWVSC